MDSSVLDSDDRFFLPFDPKDHLTTSRTRRNLPHWDQSGATAYVTFRLADSIPRAKLDEWKAERDEWRSAHPEPWSEDDWREYQTRFLDRIERWSDRGYGRCLLRDPEVRTIVSDAFEFFDEERYRLDHFVIMPNHVHLLVRPFGEWRLSQLLHSWKSFTANQINSRLGRSGTLWMDERFDHLVRSVTQLDIFHRYIVENPQKARLSEDAFTIWKRV